MNLNDIYEENASLGRFGDTEMRMVDGSPSHVNTEEAHVIDMYGAQGEKLVKASGSGTINPDTGLDEYWIQYIPAMIAGASWLLGTISEGSQGAANEDKAEIQAQSAADTIDVMEQAKLDLDLVETTGIASRKAGYVEDVEDLGFKTGKGVKKIKDQGERLRQKIDFAYSGTGEKAIDYQRSMLVEGSDRTRRSMWSAHQENLSKFGLDIANQRREIDSNISIADANRQISERQAETWYPWKFTTKSGASGWSPG